ncbi:hypothetical protein C8R47DRAFT_1200555 [Mycena vitilis]|nr:hypothetical protein C8R47DRAFT_1200555 [Mycena vitilis]
MTRTVPLSALATSDEDTDTKKLKRRYLFPMENVTLHRHMEYLWGLEICTINPKHKRSIIKFRKSMANFPTGCGWTLVPREETLGAMNALQVHNFTVPISKRKSFLTEFSAKEYEYIFVPLYTDIDFFILEAGRAPQRFSAPYTDFPLVTSSANPFFVTFYSWPKVPRIHEPASKTWHRQFGDLKIQWRPFPLPEDFLRSYAPTLITLTNHGSKPELHYEGSDSKSGSDGTVATSADEALSLVPNKDVHICHWVHQTGQLYEPLPPPPLPPQRRRNSKQQKTIPFHPRWRTESKLGKAFAKGWLCHRMLLLWTSITG